MKSSNVFMPEQLEDEFGERIAARLSQGLPDVSHDVMQRLRMLRIQAVGRRRIQNVRAHSAHAIVNGNSTLTSGNGSGSGSGNQAGIWGWFASVLPLVALVGGLVLIHDLQNDARLKELAEVDSALLTDALPPSAYADPGFTQFLRVNAQANR